MRADVVIADVTGVPDVVARATGWTPDRHGGGATGAELPTAMLAGIREHLTPGGRAYLPTGTLQDEQAVVQTARRVFGEEMQPVAIRDFPLPDVVARAKEVARLISEQVIQLRERGSRLFWRLTIWRCGDS